MSIDQPDERVLFNCFSNRGCTDVEIAEALGLRYDELWDEPAQACEVCGKLTLPDPQGRYMHSWHGQPDGSTGAVRPGRPTRPARARRPVLGRLPDRLLHSEEVVEDLVEVEAYSHTDEIGTVVAESVRYEGTAHLAGSDQAYRVKTFRPRYAGQRGWLSRKPVGLAVPIWRLPEIQAAIAEDREIAHAEGHKDAKSLLANGMEATTNITTAFTADHAEQLRGARVLVVCDRDEAGYRRGLRAEELLTGMASAVRLVLPAITEKKADAFDHFAAGFTVDDFVPVDRSGLEVLLAVEKADNAVLEVASEIAEIRARLEQGRIEQDADNPDAAARHAQAAIRWAQETGRKLLGLDAVAGSLPADVPAHMVEQVRRQLQRRVADAADLVAEAHTLTGAEAEAEVADLVERCAAASASDAGTVQADAGAGVGAGGDGWDVDNVSVLSFPGGAWRPEHPLPSSAPRQEWAYSVQPDRRGVYLFTKLSAADPGRWQLMAPLPVIHPPVVRRDGEGRRLATDFLLAAGADTAAVRIDHVALHSGGWANIIGMPLSDDSKVIAQVGSAIRYEAAKLPETEDQVVFDDDTDQLTMPQEPPTGYFEAADVDEAAALDTWREIIGLLTPKMALVLGASAFAPYLRASDVKSHVMSLTGGSQQGKSTTLLVAAALWGNCLAGPSALYGSWNLSAQGLPRILGELRILPAFRDESGLAGLEPAQWGKLIYGVTEGNSRGTPDRVRGFHSTRPWWGILFSTGNGEMTARLGSGYTQGIPRRVIEIAAPFTTSRDDARRIVPEGATQTGLLSQCYGHLGQLLIRQVTAGDARDRLAAVHDQGLLDPPEHAADLALQLDAHLAGASMIDELLGTNLLELAVDAAQELLEAWRPPPAEADRVLEIITESIEAEPSRWPSRDNYTAHLQTDGNDPTTTTRLPYVGVNREVYGVRLQDDLDTVWVFGRGWKALITDGSDTNSKVALSQLEQRSILYRSPEARGGNDYTMVEALRIGPGPQGRKRSRCYILRLAIADGATPQATNDPPPDPPPNDPSGDTPPDDFSPDGTSAGPATGEAGAVTGPVTGKTSPVTGETWPVTGAVTGSKPAPARAVTGVTGFSGEASRNTREEMRLQDSTMAEAVIRAVADPAALDGTPQDTHQDTHQDDVTCGGPDDATAGGPGAGTSEAAKEEPVEDLVKESLVELDPDADTAVFHSSLGTEHRRQRALEPGLCQHCHAPTVHVLDGHRLHPRCLEDQLRSDTASLVNGPVHGASSDPSTPPADRGGTRAGELTAETTAAWTDEQLDAAVQDHLDDPEALDALERLIDAREAAARHAAAQPADPRTARTTANGVARRARVDVARRPDRFAAPAAVLDAEHAHLPGQPPAPWQAEHLGQLALLTGPDRLRLGWGGGEDRFPDEGQLWLDAAALQRLGLPATVDVPDGLAVSSRARQAAVERAFKPLLKLPAVADALADGWRIGKHGLDAWTRIWHPDLLPSGAWLVAIPWQRVDDVPLLENLDEARTAAHLAERLAGWAAAVGISYRLSPASTGVDLVDHTRPPRRSHDDDLGVARNRRALVRGEPAELPEFLRQTRDDRFRTVETDFSWWRPWTSLLASERVQPYVALYDRGRSYLGPWSNIDLGLEGLTHHTGPAARWDGSEKPGYYLVDRWDWEAWWLPDPAGAVSAFVERNRVWVTSHTLRQLKAQGVEPVVHEAYTWAVTSRYLEPAAQRIRSALDAHTEPAVEKTIKALYSSTVGKWGERDHRHDYHQWRPDWRHHIIANTRTAILHTLRKVHDRPGAAAALVVDRDAIAFAVDDPDPWKAWPGEPNKLGTGTGQWKPVGVAPLHEWGQRFLPKAGRTGQKWAYRDAVAALDQDLTRPDQQSDQR